ncbi:MAG: DUF695 domain-containing protein [Actinobacteria bacterium]|nr:DUF695 domain-containing protein [Actinomycetota bacterium]
MGLFSRRKSPESVARAQALAIDDFWHWWRTTGSRETAQAIADNAPERITDALAKHVHAIDGALSWELGAGAESSAGGSRHVLVVTPEGDPALRAVARRWLLAAPEPDATWEYSDSRRATAPDGLLTLGIGGARIDVGRATIAARVEGPVVDVTVHHPDFADLAEDVRRLTAFLMLDATVGETEVELWVREIGTTTVPPLDPVPLAGLRSVVRQLREQYTDADGGPTWVLLHGVRHDGTPLVASTQVPLKSVTAPHFDTHAGVVVPYTDQTPEGLPGPDGLAELRRFEDHLAGRLEGCGRLVAHETSGGTRLLHFYVDGTTPAVEQLEAAVVGWSQGRVRVQAEHDPAWSGVQHLRV